MKYLDEYRDPAAVTALLEAIRAATTRPWRLMEVCGGQTHSIVRHGLDTLLPSSISLIHGPGCPVCVTPVDIIDKAIAIARRPDALLCSFGDMLRVPGSRASLAQARAEGARVQMVYSPLDAVQLARQQPQRQVVFLAVGFETTAPAHAVAVLQARALGLTNFSLLVSHVLVPPAIAAIASRADSRIDAFLAAGHVCAVMGEGEYADLAPRLQVPIVVTGFEPVDLLRGVLLAVRQLEQGRAEFDNAYARAVHREGNRQAQELLREVFEVVPRRWRGIGALPRSGLGLREAFADFDAERRFGVERIGGDENPDCIAGEVLSGAKRPVACPAFGRDCTPEHPLGAPMVSAEGACAAYYRYRRPAGAGPRAVSP
jgi:hydrogenase expression/formation protein HypD